jgi:hypothetical protein
VGSIAIAGGVAIAIVLVTRGSLRRLLRLPIQSIWMLVVALAIQIALEFVDVPKDRIDNVGFVLLMASYALLLAFCFVNLRVPAMWIVALGIALNTVVIGLNQGMPTRDREVTTRSGRTVEQPIKRSVKHRPESNRDLLPFLGDQIVIPEPVHEVISVGDIVLGFGIVAVCYRGSRRRRARSTQRDARNRHAQAPRPRVPPPRPARPRPAPSPDSGDDALGAELDQAYARLSRADRRHEPVTDLDEDEGDDRRFRRE